MARGEMVRWMAEHQIQTAEDLKQFTGLGFAFEESLSSGTEYVFLKKISARKIRLFLFCLHFPDLSARDHSAGVSGRLGCHIILMCVYDNRSSDHILGMKSICVKDQNAFPSFARSEGISPACCGCMAFVGL